MNLSKRGRTTEIDKSDPVSKRAGLASTKRAVFKNHLQVKRHLQTMAKASKTLKMSLGAEPRRRTPA